MFSEESQRQKLHNILKLHYIIKGNEKKCTNKMLMLTLHIAIIYIINFLMKGCSKCDLTKTNAHNDHKLSDVVKGQNQVGILT